MPRAGVAAWACAALLAAGCDTGAQFAPPLPPAAGFRVDDGVLRLWTGTPCEGVTGLRLTFDSGTPTSTDQYWTAPPPGIRLERVDLLPTTDSPLDVDQPLPDAYDWTTATTLTIAVDGPPSLGARVDLPRLLRESPDNPPERYLFGDRWLAPADVTRENGHSFLTICTVPGG